MAKTPRLNYADASNGGLLSAGAQTIVGVKTFNNLRAEGGAVFNDNGSAVDFRIEGDGQQHLFYVSASNDFVGVGDSNPERRLTVKANASSDDAIYVRKVTNDASGGQKFILFGIGDGIALSGGISANGANACQFYGTSDARLKENIVGIPPQLDNILALKPSEFDYKDGTGHQTGFIAQDIQAVYPDVITEDANGFLAVIGWGKTEARLVRAIQEQQTIIGDLKARIAVLEA